MAEIENNPGKNISKTKKEESEVFDILEFLGKIDDIRKTKE